MSLNPSQPGDGPRVRITEITAERVPGTFDGGVCIAPSTHYPTLRVASNGSPPYASGSAIVLYGVWLGTMDFTLNVSTGTNFTWLKDGVPLNPLISAYTLANWTGVLAMEFAQPADSGVYTCVFNGRCGSASNSITITVV